MIVRFSPREDRQPAPDEHLRQTARLGEGWPRRGGVLLAVIGADPPSLDPHQESTFANIELVAPLYSTLLQLDPYSYPKVIGDIATRLRRVTPLSV